MTAPPRRAEAARLALYLEMLFARARPTTLIELRWRADGGMRRRFTPVGERRALVPLIAELGARHELYIGVLPRWRRAGGRSAVVGDCRTVWVDLDGAAAVRKLASVDPAPTVVVASGGGQGHLHAYWSLHAAQPPAVIERANRRLAWALHADRASTDAARLLRPPQTLNHRRAGAPVRLLAAAPSSRSRLDQLLAGLPDPPGSAPIRSRASRPPSGDPLLALSPERYVLALTGQRVGRDRKVRCPLHDDYVPSLHVYEDPTRGWYCFGCGRGGSVYDLAAALWLTDRPEPTRLRGEEFRLLRDRLAARLLGRTHSGHARP